MEYEAPTQTTTKSWIYACRKDDKFHQSDTQPGKWIIVRRGNIIDQSWRIIHNLVVNGKLSCAKVVTKSGNRYPENDRYVICVYVSHSQKVEEVKRVRDVLRAAGFVERLKYKTDASTVSGINDYMIEE